MASAIMMELPIIRHLIMLSISAIVLYLSAPQCLEAFNNFTTPSVSKDHFDSWRILCYVVYIVECSLFSSLYYSFCTNLRISVSVGLDGGSPSLHRGTTMSYNDFKLLYAAQRARRANFSSLALQDSAAFAAPPVVGSTPAHIHPFVQSNSNLNVLNVPTAVPSVFTISGLLFSISDFLSDRVGFDPIMIVCYAVIAGSNYTAKLCCKFTNVLMFIRSPIDRSIVFFTAAFFATTGRHATTILLGAHIFYDFFMSEEVRELIGLSFGHEATLLTGNFKETCIRVVVGSAAGIFPEYSKYAASLRIEPIHWSKNVGLLPFVRFLLGYLARFFLSPHAGRLLLLLSDLGFSHPDLIVESFVEMFYYRSDSDIIDRGITRDMAAYSLALQLVGIPYSLEVKCHESGRLRICVKYHALANAYSHHFKPSALPVGDMFSRTTSRCAGAVLGHIARYLDDRYISSLTHRYMRMRGLDFTLEADEETSEDAIKRPVRFSESSSAMSLLSSFPMLSLEKNFRYSYTDRHGNEQFNSVDLSDFDTRKRDKLYNDFFDGYYKKYVNERPGLGKEGNLVDLYYYVKSLPLDFKRISSTLALSSAGVNLNMINNYARSLYEKGDSVATMKEKTMDATVLHWLADFYFDSFPQSNKERQYSSFFPQGTPTSRDNLGVRLAVARTFADEPSEESGQSRLGNKAAKSADDLAVAQVRKRVAVLTPTFLTKKAAAQQAIDDTKEVIINAFAKFREHMKAARDNTPAIVNGKHSKLTDFEELAKTLSANMANWTAEERGLRTRTLIHQDHSQVDDSKDRDESAKPPKRVNVINAAGNARSSGPSMSIKVSSSSQGKHKPRSGKGYTGIKSARAGTRQLKRMNATRLMAAQSGESVGDDNTVGRTAAEDDLMDAYFAHVSRMQDDMLGGDERAGIDVTYDEFLDLYARGRLDAGVSDDEEERFYPEFSLASSEDISRFAKEYSRIYSSLLGKTVSFKDDGNVEELESDSGEAPFYPEAKVGSRMPDLTVANGCVFTCYFGNVSDTTECNKTVCVYMPGSYIVFPLDLFIDVETLKSGSRKKVLEKYNEVLKTHACVYVSNGAHMLPLSTQELKPVPGQCEIQFEDIRGVIVGAVILRARLVPTSLANRPKQCLALRCNLERSGKRAHRNDPTTLCFGLQKKSVVAHGTSNILEVTSFQPVWITDKQLLIHDINTEAGDCGSPVFSANNLVGIHVGTAKDGGKVKNFALKLKYTFEEDPLICSGKNVIPDDALDPRFNLAINLDALAHECATTFVSDNSPSDDLDVSFSHEGSRLSDGCDYVKTLVAKLPEKFRLVARKNNTAYLDSVTALSQIDAVEAYGILFRDLANQALKTGLVTIAPPNHGLAAFIPPAKSAKQSCLEEEMFVPLLSYTNGYFNYAGTSDTKLVELSKGANPPHVEVAKVELVVEHLKAIIERINAATPNISYVKVSDIINVSRCSASIQDHLIWQCYRLTATTGSPAGINHMIPALKDCTTKKEVINEIENGKYSDAEKDQMRAALITLARTALQSLSGSKYAPTSMPIYVYSKDDDAYKKSKLEGGAHRNVCQPAWPFSIVDYMMSLYVFSPPDSPVTEEDFKSDKIRNLTFVSMDYVLGRMRYSQSSPEARNHWTFGGNIFGEVVSFAEDVPSDSNVFCYDVTQWDRNVPRKLASSLYTFLYRGKQIPAAISDVIANNFCRSVNGGGTYIIEGKLYLLKKGGFAWCSGANKTLSGNTLMHCALLSAAGVDKAITMGDDGVAVVEDELHKERLVSTFKGVGLSLKVEEMAAGKFDFCGLSLDLKTKSIVVDLTKIMNKRCARNALRKDSHTMQSLAGDIRSAFTSAHEDMRHIDKTNNNNTRLGEMYSQWSFSTV